MTDNVRPIEVAKQAAKARAWEKGLICNDEGTPKKGMANVLHVLSQHPQWDGVLAYDAFRECTVKVKCPPVRPQDGVSEPGEWSETDSTRTVGWFASEVGFEPASMHVDQAVMAAAERKVIHPVRDYLDALVWDGTPRLDGMLATYFGAADTPYSRAIGARWMISAVARVKRPGCQADCMLVLESSKQGMGKSTGLEALTGKEWFADTGVNIGDKDSYQALRGKWIYEFGELDAIKGREVTKVKNFVSARVDTYRPSYGRRTRDFPRQTSFAGTTNEDAYLVDRSGNRRFWPVRCGAIDVSAIHRDRDQLWAEAVSRYSAGERWHVDTPELRALCEEEQRDREVEDPWVQLVGKWLREQIARGDIKPENGITTTQVMAGALAMDPGAMHHSLTIRVGHVLRALRWEPKQLRRDGEQVRLYFKVSQSSQVDADSDCDGLEPEKQAYQHMSQTSHTQIHAHIYAQGENAQRSLFLERDNCDSDPDALERAAIEAEGRGQL